MDRCLHVKKKPDRSSWPLQKGDRKPEEFLHGWLKLDLLFQCHFFKTL